MIKSLGKSALTLARVLAAAAVILSAYGCGKDKDGDGEDSPNGGKPSLSATSLSMEAGAKARVEVTGAADFEVRSSDTGVARAVRQGCGIEVEGVAPGRATVSAVLTPRHSLSLEVAVEPRKTPHPLDEGRLSDACPRLETEGAESLRMDDGGVIFERDTGRGVLRGVRISDGHGFVFSPATMELSIDGERVELSGGEIAARREGREWHNLVRAADGSRILIVM